MSTLPTNAAASIAAAPHAPAPDARRDRAARVDAKRPARAPDEVVVHAATADTARALASNDQEEAREDRQSQTFADGRSGAPRGDASIDLRG